MFDIARIIQLNNICQHMPIWINLQMYDFYLVQRELDVKWYVDLYGKLIKIGGGLIIIIMFSTYISLRKSPTH